MEKFNNTTIGKNTIFKGDRKYNLLMKNTAKALGVKSLSKAQRISAVKQYNTLVIAKNKVRLEDYYNKTTNNTNSESLANTANVLGFNSKSIINSSKFRQVKKAIDNMKKNFNSFIKKNNRLHKKELKKGETTTPYLSENFTLEDYNEMSGMDDYGDSLGNEYANANATVLNYAKQINIWIKQGIINNYNGQNYLNEFDRLIRVSPSEKLPGWVETAYLELQNIVASDDYSKTPKERHEDELKRVRAEIIDRLRKKAVW